MSNIQYSSEEVNVTKSNLKPGWKIKTNPDIVKIGLEDDHELVALLAEQINTHLDAKLEYGNEKS